MKLIKLRLNNRGYILLEYVIYMLILSIILVSLSNMIVTFIKNSNTIDYSLERIEENLTDVMTIKNIILKSDKIIEKKYNVFNTNYIILNFIDEEEDLISKYSKLKFYIKNDRYEFNDRIGNFENTNDTKIYYYPENENLLYINNENNNIKILRVLDLSQYNIIKSDKNE